MESRRSSGTTKVSLLVGIACANARVACRARRTSRLTFYTGRRQDAFGTCGRFKSQTVLRCGKQPPLQRPPDPTTHHARVLPPPTQAIWTRVP